MTYLAGLECELVGGVKKCCDVLEHALSENLVSKSFACPKCAFPHLDEGEWMKKRDSHFCMQCDHVFHTESTCVGNPVAKVVTADVIERLRAEPEAECNEIEICSLR